MSDIDINRFLNKFGMNSFGQQRAMGVPKPMNNAPAQQPHANVTNNSPSIPKQPSVQIVQPSIISANNIQMQGTDRAIYARDLFQMPKNMNEFIYMMQRGLTQAQFNQMFANQYLQKNQLSQMQAQILAQLQSGNISQETQTLNQLNNFKNFEIVSGGLINLNDISIMLQKNGKEALTKLIMAMTESSKAGINDLSQIKEMAKLVNASIAVAAENTPTKTMKLLIMLYLPWLPLQEGVGFDLDLTTKSQDEEEADNILKISITTIHYGIINATLMLDTSNSIQTVIECSKSFPKRDLEERIKQENKKYSMESVTSFIEGNETKVDNTQVNVTLNSANTHKVNPFLLLLAHCIIRHVIEIDNNG